MATVDTIFSGQRFLPRLEVGNNLRSMLNKVSTNLDGFIEYPGSLKSIDSEGGWWRFEEWAIHKIDLSLKKRGERV